MIRIYDGNNYYRRILETNTNGKAPREVLVDTINCPDVQIWVWDGEHGNARRRELYPDYKANRKAVRTDIYAGFDTVQTVLRHTRAFQITVPGYEGDDVVATLAAKYADAGNEVGIYSTDFDFAQLAGEYQGRVFCGARLKDHVPSSMVRHYKSWVGDPSDNIRGVPGFGDVTWERTDKEVIRRATAAILYSERGDDPAVHDGSWSPNPVSRSRGPLADYNGSFSRRVEDWFCDPANCATFKTYWDIVGFYDVPEMLIDKHLICGVEDYYAADTYLKQWMI